MKTLKDVKVGETVTVAKLHGEGPVPASWRVEPLPCSITTAGNFSPSAPTGTVSVAGIW